MPKTSAPVFLDAKIGDRVAVAGYLGAPSADVSTITHVTASTIETDGRRKWRRSDGCQTPQNTGRWRSNSYARPATTADLAAARRAGVVRALERIGRSEKLFDAFTDEEIETVAAAFIAGADAVERRPHSPPTEDSVGNVDASNRAINLAADLRRAGGPRG